MWQVLLAVFFIYSPPGDQAVFNVIQVADPALVYQKVLYRIAVSCDLDP